MKAPDKAGAGRPVAITVDAAFLQIGFGAYQRRLCFIAGLGWMTDLLELSILSVLLPVLEGEWNLTSQQKGFLGSAVYAGARAAGRRAASQVTP